MSAILSIRDLPQKVPFIVILLPMVQVSNRMHGAIFLRILRRSFVLVHVQCHIIDENLLHRLQEF